MKRIYAGIGSRETPEEVSKNVIIPFAEYLAKKDWILRSGGAEGADSAFEEGCDLAKGKKEIFLPWPGFNGNKSTFSQIPLAAFKTAAFVWQKRGRQWESTKPAVQKFMARNAMQILGINMIVPVDFVVCWTPGGKLTGGTAQALKHASILGIPIFNIGKFATTGGMREALNMFWRNIK